VIISLNTTVNLTIENNGQEIDVVGYVATDSIRAFITSLYAKPRKGAVYIIMDGPCENIWIIPAVVTLARIATDGGLYPEEDLLKIIRGVY